MGQYKVSDCRYISNRFGHKQSNQSLYNLARDVESELTHDIAVMFM